MNRILIDFVDFPDLLREQNPLQSVLARRFDLASSEYPDYVVFTQEGTRHRLYSCTKIFYTQERFLPDWRTCDYAVLSVKANDPRAFHLPYYSLWRRSEALVRCPDCDYRSVLGAKTGFCSFLAGYDDRSVRARSEFFGRLTHRKHVDSGGRALNNMGRQVAPGLEAKMDFLRPYKFHLAFENTDLPGYTTEKLPDAFAAFAVPVFWGDITVKEQFNPAAFIDRRDFASDEACIEHILKVDADDELYLKYLSAPPFHDNKPNAEWNHERLLDFFEMIFNRPPDPVAQRHWLWRLTKRRLVERIKTHAQKGMPSAGDRFRERTRQPGPPDDPG